MAQVNKRTLQWIREVGLPELADGQIDALAARIRESYAAELAQQEQELQIGADPRSNVGGQTWPDNVEDCAPIMLDNIIV
jgi:hypothetical protein